MVDNMNNEALIIEKLNTLQGTLKREEDRATLTMNELKVDMVFYKRRIKKLEDRIYKLEMKANE